MKFLCPNCKAKYRIGSEKLVGRQAAKIRCRKCEYRIQISYLPGSDDYEITATPNSVAPAPPPRALKSPSAPPALGPPVPIPPPGAVPRARAAAKDEGLGAKKPTAAVPGLPGLGSPRSTRGAALHAEGAPGLAPLPPLAPPPVARRPLAPPPPGPLPPLAPPPALAPVAPAAAPALLPLGGVLGGGAPGPAAARPAPVATPLADQFRQSVQAGGAASSLTEDTPREGWFVGVNGVPLGPIPVGDLRELAVAGHIDRRSLVWREGQAEWRPLGKFPHLVRVLEDGPESTRPAAPEPEPAASAPQVNGSNGHVGGAFDPPAVEITETARPSAWGDLDDEDDEDEQPTTVKGRVSVPPPGTGDGMSAQGFGRSPLISAPPGPPPNAPPASTPPPGPPPAFSFGGPSPAAVTRVVSAVQPLSAPPVTPDGPASSISATPEPTVEYGETDAMRGRGRGRVVAVLAVAAAFALGAILMHVLGTGGAVEAPKGPAPETKRALAPAEETNPAPPPPAVVAEPAPRPEPAATEPVPPARAVERPAEAATVNKPPSSITPAAAHDPAPPPPKPMANPTLLSGLGGPQATVPLLAPRGDTEHPGGSGLDATAIQRTVRRYGPAVRQNCWQRALNSRSPGVPTSAKVTALITVDASGKVQAVTASGAPRGYPGLAKCIETSVRGWSFPRSDAETVTNVPFMFVGQ